MKKVFWGIIGCFLLAFIYCFVVDGHDIKAWTNNHTRDEAVAWANSQDGQSLDYDGVYGAQCVDLIKYYYDYLGQPAPTGNANNYDEGGKYTPEGWYYYSSPQPGDIAVSNVAPYGHVAIVVSVSGSQYVVMEQNYAYRQYCKTRTCYGGEFETFIRPDFLIKAEEHWIDLNTFVDGIEVEGENSPARFDVYNNGSIDKSNVNDYWEKRPVGTKYKIVQISLDDGYELEEIVGSAEGALGNSDIQIAFKYRTKKSTVDSSWEKVNSGTNYYCAIPKGFDTSHSLYTKYAKSSAKSSYETFTEKVVATKSVVWGYLYYHWTYNNGSLPNNNYNVFISEECTVEGNRNYKYFKAFETTNDHGHTDSNGVYGGDDVYFSWGDKPEDGSWWWFRVPVYKQDYTTYQKKKTPTPTPTPTPMVTVTPTPTPTGVIQMPTRIPITLTPIIPITGKPKPTGLVVTVTATPVPTEADVTPTATQIPTVIPTVTQVPTVIPTVTQAPTVIPTVTQVPTVIPTVTQFPTVIPTVTQVPTVIPTVTQVPTVIPTVTQVPTVIPTVTQSPTATPTPTVTEEPRVMPGDIVEVKSIKYSIISEDEVSVQGLGKNKSTIKIPSSVTIDGNEYDVIGIEKNAFKNNKKLKKVTIVADLDYIGENAFAGCKKLKSLIISGDVTEILSKAFYKCKKLNNIVITTKAIERIESKAFSKIYSQVTVEVPKSLKDEYIKLLKKGGIPSRAKIE